MRRTLLILAAVVMVAVVFLLVSPAKDGFRAIVDRFGDGSPSQPEVVASYPVSKPRLTEDEKAAAREILLQDPSFNALVAGRQYTIEGFGAGLRRTAEGFEKIGALIRVSFAAPQAIEGDWPMSAAREDGGVISYDERLRHMAFTNVQKLDVVISFERQKVMDIIPDGNAEQVSPER